MIFVLYLKVLPRSFIKWDGGNWKGGGGGGVGISRKFLNLGGS